MTLPACDRIIELANRPRPNQRTAEMNTPEEQLERAEIQLREICLLCGFDPSDGEGTSPEEVTAVVKRKFDEHRSLETAAQGLADRLREMDAMFSAVSKCIQWGKTFLNADAIRQMNEAPLNAAAELARFDALKEGK